MKVRIFINSKETDIEIFRKDDDMVDADGNKYQYDYMEHTETETKVYLTKIE
jgi:hypothetical protein